MKKKRILLCLVSLFLLTGCGRVPAVPSLPDIREEIALFREEIGEMAQFFDKDRIPSEKESIYARPAVPDITCPPVLTMLPQVELVESPYQSPAYPVFDAGTPVPAAAIPARRTEDETAGYTRVPLLTDRRSGEVQAFLEAHGLTVETEERTNTAPAGEVFALRYAGMRDEEAYYVNPAVPVRLYVSAEKKAKTAEGRQPNLVYLTFDDGPTESDTFRLLDILDTYGVKASFFSLGTLLQKYPASAAAVVQRGHTLGCHSVSHQYDLIYQSTEALEAEVVAWEQMVQDLGVEQEGKIFRFPGGSVSSHLTKAKSAAMQEMLREHGYTVFDWNVVTNDALLFQAEEGEDTYTYIQRNFLSTLDLCLRENAKKENAPIIILMHETVPETVDLMPWMLEYLIREGYTFGDLSTFGDSFTFADRS